MLKQLKQVIFYQKLGSSSRTYFPGNYAVGKRKPNGKISKAFANPNPTKKLSITSGF
jgi:hypothetical protein